MFSCLLETTIHDTSSVVSIYCYLQATGSNSCFFSVKSDLSRSSRKCCIAHTNVLFETTFSVLIRAYLVFSLDTMVFIARQKPNWYHYCNIGFVYGTRPKLFLWKRPWKYWLKNLHLCIAWSALQVRNGCDMHCKDWNLCGDRLLLYCTWFSAHRTGTAPVLQLQQFR